ncbi:MAG: formate dehydrogenase subunit delta [Steroidobacteraceae bacterium]
MKIDYLVSMANDISSFFDAESGDDAARNIASHIGRFWDRRMRAQIIAHLASGGAGLSASAVAAVRQLPPVKPL